MLLKNDLFYLRALEPEDLEILYKWENDSSVWAAGDALGPYSYYSLKKYIDEVNLQSIYDLKTAKFIIARIDDDAVIGMIDLFNFDPHNSKVELGILIDSQFRRLGYSTAALDIVKQYVFDFLKIHQIYCKVPKSNTTSQAMLKSVGFVQSGILIDWSRSLDGFEDVIAFQLII